MDENTPKNSPNPAKKIQKVSQEQVHDLLFGKEVSWHAIIYDLINTEQLDPWDMDISLLADKYLEKIKGLEEANYVISSKVLLAAALLLRIKSEILLNDHIKSIDEILFGKKTDQKVHVLERIELDEDIPELLPRSPLPRSRKISLKELMASLNQAIATENRRISKHILEKNALREVSISLPKKRMNIKDKIKEIYDKAISLLNLKENHKVPFSEIAGNTKEEKISAFTPALHLEHQKKIWLSQDQHFDEIYVWLHEVFHSNHNIYDKLCQELEETEIKSRDKKKD